MRVFVVWALSIVVLSWADGDASFYGKNFDVKLTTLFL